MPTLQQHREYATKGAALARNIYDEHPREGGEILWGALIQAAQARQHENGDQTHLQSKSEIRKIIASLGLSRQNLEIRLNHVANAATFLHGGFYHRGLGRPDTHRHYFDKTQHLINLLMNS